jgi:UDP-glucuronate decarboxylase
LPEDDPRQRRPDISRARKILGWTPRVSLDEGLVPTIAYFAEIRRHDTGSAVRDVAAVPKS